MVTHSEVSGLCLDKGVICYVYSDDTKQSYGKACPISQEDLINLFNSLKQYCSDLYWELHLQKLNEQAQDRFKKWLLKKCKERNDILKEIQTVLENTNDDTTLSSDKLQQVRCILGRIIKS